MNEHRNISRDHVETWRHIVFLVVLAGVMTFYLVRLFDLQVASGQSYVERAEDNRTEIINIPTQRGNIQDRNGIILARNVGSYNVTITPAYLPGDEGAKQEVYRRLSSLVNVPVSAGEINEITVRTFKPCDNDLGIEEIVYIADTNAPYRPVQIKCNVGQEMAMIVQQKAVDMPGVGIEIIPVRDYPTGWLTAEIIGFLGPIPAVSEGFYRRLGFVPNRDKVGYAGIELEKDDVLRGINGQRVVEVDSAGKIIRDVEEPINPVPGANLTLTIDMRLQQAAKQILKNELVRLNGRYPDLGLNNAVIIAMNPKTGEILTLVSEPTYENNRFAQIIPAYYYEQLQRDQAKPLFNHAISAELPPGSVFKMAAALGVLTEGVVTPEYEVDCRGTMSIEERYSPNEPGSPREYFCWIHKDGGEHGWISYIRGIAESCNIYWMKVGGGFPKQVPQGLGIWRLGEYARALGYDQETGIELPGEADGLMPDPSWKRINLGENWATGDTYNATIGQGYVLATPLQVLVSIATIANDGKMMQPTIIKEIMDADGNIIQPFTPKLKWDITEEKLITVFDENLFPTNQKISVPKWVVTLAKQGMREVVVSGTASAVFEGFNIPSAGKTGTAEYCDNVAQSKLRCKPGQWPAHAWYVGYAPYDDPEIVILAYVYNGNEGSRVAAPIVKKVMEAYFEFKAIDAAKNQ